MQRPERSNRETVAEHAPERAIAAVLLGTEPIAMLDPRSPAAEVPDPRTELEINADQADKDLTQDIKFTDFGSPDPITVPRNSVPAPAAVYEFLNA